MPGNDRVLLVEGPDDKHVVRHLSNRHKEMPEFCILEKEGIENLLEDIGLEILAPGRKALGILVDANDDLNARWSAVAGQASRGEYRGAWQPRTRRYNYGWHPSRRYLVDARQYIARRTRRFRLRNDPRRRSRMATGPALH